MYQILCTRPVFATCARTGYLDTMEDERDLGISPADWLIKEQESIAKLQDANGWSDDDKHVKMLHKAMWTAFRNNFQKSRSASSSANKKKFPTKGIVYVWTRVKNKITAKSWGGAKDKLNVIYDGRWQQDNSCPNSSVKLDDTKYPARRYCVLADDRSCAVAVARLILIKEGQRENTYIAYEGKEKVDEEEEAEEEEEEEANGEEDDDDEEEGEDGEEGNGDEDEGENEAEEEEEEEQEEPPPKKKKRAKEEPAPLAAKGRNRRAAGSSSPGAAIEPIAPRPFPIPLAHSFCPCARRRSRISPGEMKCYAMRLYVQNTYILYIFLVYFDS